MASVRAGNCASVPDIWTLCVGVTDVTMETRAWPSVSKYTCIKGIFKSVTTDTSYLLISNCYVCHMRFPSNVFRILYAGSCLWRLFDDGVCVPFWKR